MQRNLANKVVLITGGSQGIGAASAKAFAECGSHLVLTARNEVTLNATKSELANAYPQCQILTFAFPAQDLKQWPKVLEQILAHFGRLDIVVNNAGANHRGNLETISPDEIQEIFDVNLIAPVILSRLVLPIFIKQSQTDNFSPLNDLSGQFIHIASLNGRTPNASQASYCSTKFGLRAFSYSLDEELILFHGGKIRSSLVSPGPVITPFVMSDVSKVPDIVFSQKPVFAEEVAKVVIATAKDAKPERCTGDATSPLLTHLGYLFPKLKRALLPIMLKKGKRNKAKCQAKYASSNPLSR